MPKIVARAVSKWFRSTGQQPVLALDGVDLEVKEGEFLALLGPSGCGKSTFLYTVGGFLRPDSGDITVDGRPVVGPGTDRGVVFQEFALFPWLTVLDNVTYGLREKGLPRDEAVQVARRYLQMTNLNRFEKHYPKQLSGGMKQRVAIARALACDPDILLMDEPFGALDAQTRALMQDELQNIWQQTGKTVLFVTHGVDEAIHLADRIAIFSARPGRIKTQVTVDLPRPRVRGAELRERRYAELLEYVWDELKEEVAAAEDRSAALAATET